MSIRVRLEHGQGAGATWRLASPGVYVVGRVPQASVQVLDMRVSKEHAEIHLTANGTAVLKDLGSTHGCQVNGQPVNGEAALKVGDELRMGLSILRILSDGPANKDAVAATNRTVDDRSPHATGEFKIETARTLPPDALVGKELGGYRVERKIGAGGMGGVYVAEQLSLHRKVALKVLSEQFAADRDFVDQFVNEARAAGALNHPNVVQVYDVGQSDGQYYFSMEVMPGGSIEDRIKQGPAPWSDALNWFLDAANALIFARRKGILHRDVKPDNLMLAEDGSAKLCDLGLAKRSENTDLMSQGIIGTPHFISPEAIRRRPDIDHRTDLYGLGCTFYRILTGKNPYPGATVKEILLGHLNKPVPRVAATVPDVPKDLDEIVFTLMQKEVEKRYATPEDLLAALDKVRLQYGLEAHGIKPGGKRPLVIAILAGLVALGVGIFAATKGPEFVEKPKSEEDLAAERRTAIRSVEASVGTTTNEAGSALVKLQARLTDPDFPLKSSGDNWKDARWITLADDFERGAEGWKVAALELREKARHADIPEIQDHWQRGANVLEENVRQAELRASEIRKYVQDRRDNEIALSGARSTARDDLAAALGAHKAKVEEAVRADDLVTAALLLRKSVVESLYADVAARKFNDEIELLSATEIEKAVGQAFGKPDAELPFYAKDVLDSVQAAARTRYEEIETAARNAAGPDATPEGLTASMVALDEFAKSLPADPDPESGPYGEFLRGQVHAARALRDSLKLRRREVVVARYANDRRACFALLHALFRPASSKGLLATLDTTGAKTAAAAFAREVQSAEYRELGAWWIQAVDGVSEALDQLIAAYPAGWTSDRITYHDERGRVAAGKIKGIDRTTIVREKDRVPLGSLGPVYVVNHLFRDAAKPRVELTGAARLGLGVLAEVAGEYDLAAAEYAAWRDSLAPEDERRNGVERRIASLDAERRAATLWREAWRRHAEIEETVNRLDPTLIGLDAFDDAKRQEVAEKESAWLASLQSVSGILITLQEERALASTAWLAGLVGEMPKGAAYAGEETGDEPDGP